MLCRSLCVRGALTEEGRSATTKEEWNAAPPQGEKSTTPKRRWRKQHLAKEERVDCNTTQKSKWRKQEAQREHHPRRECSTTQKEELRFSSWSTVAFLPSPDGWCRFPPPPLRVVKQMFDPGGFPLCWLNFRDLGPARREQNKTGQ